MDENLTQLQFQPTIINGSINANVETIEPVVALIEAKYAKLVLEESDIPFAKKTRADLNKLVNFISDERIRVKKEFNLPVARFEAELKPLVERIGKAIENIDTQVKACENRKRQAVRAFYEELWATYQIPGVEFGQVYDPRWENESASQKQSLAQFNTAIQRINGDLDFIKGMDNPLERNFTKENYLKTLDIVKAQSYARDMMRVINTAKKETEPVETPDQEPTDTILGMKIKLDVTSDKKEYKAIYVEPSLFDFTCKLLEAHGVKYIL